MEIQCSFEIVELYGENTYGCVVRSQNITENCNIKFIGEHRDGKTNEDVLGIHFKKCTVSKVPKGLTKTFPNLRIMEIEESKLTNITKSDLEEYKNLEKFRCALNELEFLPSDLFEDFKYLKCISFYRNKLKIIHPNILDGLEMLNLVYLGDNPNYEKNYSNCPAVNGNASLKEIKYELFDKYPHKYEYIEDLKAELQQLKDFKANLLIELEQEKNKNAELTLKTQDQFLEDLKTFTQDETTKDFQIQIDNRQFPVHKFLLAARSPTLSEILKNNPEVENLNLVDISVETFEKILKFLYIDELPGDDGTNFLHLFAAAGKLKIEKLKNYAALNLIDQIDEDNVIETFKLSNKYGHDDLRNKSFNQIKQMYPKCDFKDSYESKVDLVLKIIDRFEKYEEEIRKLEEEFEDAVED